LQFHCTPHQYDFFSQDVVFLQISRHFSFCVLREAVAAFLAILLLAQLAKTRQLQIVQLCGSSAPGRKETEDKAEGQTMPVQRSIP
jgi:hypothetical protein